MKKLLAVLYSFKGNKVYHFKEKYSQAQFEAKMLEHESFITTINKQLELANEHIDNRVGKGW